MGKDNLPLKPTGKSPATRTSSATDLADFLKSVKSAGSGNSGRLIFAMDATMSRQASWDRACAIQGDMFASVDDVGKLDVQLVYFRGFGECRASKWVNNGAALGNLMSRIDCRGGQTQIAKILNHANKEMATKKVAALVFIGDAMEENVDRLCQLAGELGLKGVKMFMFLEGNDSVAEAAFREMAKLTSGAFMRLGESSANDLSKLLSAIAVFASGGQKAMETMLESSGDRNSRLLLEQIKSGRGR